MLHRVIGVHLDAFLRAAAEAGDGVGLPQFVEREFREFLTCGVFEGGVARFRCEGCALEHLVPFSCKGRGFCPSCGGRQMTERAAHLVDAVLPRVPVRQWVLTVPYRLRYRLAWDHGLSRAVLGVYARGLLDVYVRGARGRGIDAGRTGLVTVMQRAGSGLNANLHFHTLALDGVFSEGHGGALEFHPAPALRAPRWRSCSPRSATGSGGSSCAGAWNPAATRRSWRIGSPRSPPHWPGSSALRSKGGWRWALARGRGCGDSGATWISRP